MYQRTPQLGALYQTGSRFSLQGWTPDEWAKFFTQTEPGVAQLYGTIFNKPVAAVPVPVQTVGTPIGNVPTWGILAAIGIAGLVLLRRPARA